MDILFGAVSADNRAANIARHERGAYFAFFLFLVICSTYLRTTEISSAAYLERSHSNGDTMLKFDA